jgi:hypothetical protein
MHAIIRRLAWSGLANKHSEHSIQERVDGFRFALSCCTFPSACYPSFLSTPLQQSSQSACLSCTPFNACNRYEAILLTTCFSLRRGHHLEHLLCQGCHGKRICLCSRLPLRVQTCLHRLEGCAFPASGRAIITTKTTADAWALNSRSW